MDNNLKADCLKKIADVFMNLSFDEQVEVFVTAQKELIGYRNNRRDVMLNEAEAIQKDCANSVDRIKAGVCAIDEGTAALTGGKFNSEIKVAVDHSLKQSSPEVVLGRNSY